MKTMPNFCFCFSVNKSVVTAAMFSKVRLYVSAQEFLTEVVSSKLFTTLHIMALSLLFTAVIFSEDGLYVKAQES